MHRQTHAHVHHSQTKTPSPSVHEGGGVLRGGLEQRDRSLTVMIPRAKYRPTSQQAPSVLTMSTFGPEQKVLSYNNAESRQTPTKVNAHRGLYVYVFRISGGGFFFFLHIPIPNETETTGPVNKRSKLL